VEGERRRAGRLDAGHHTVETGFGRDLADAVEEGAADAASVGAPVHVDGVLDGGVVRGPLLVAGQRREPEDPIILDGDDGAEGTGTVGDPALLLLDRARHQVEGRDRVDHLVVVDLGDLVGVGDGRQSDLRGSTGHAREGSGRSGPGSAAPGGNR